MGNWFQVVWNRRTTVLLRKHGMLVEKLKESTHDIFCMYMCEVDIRSDNHMHYNKYLSSLEYHSRSGKLIVPEEHRRKLLL
jgi:hypothetical protein